MTLQELLVQQRKEFIDSGIPEYEIDYILSCITLAYQHGELNILKRHLKQLEEKS